MFSRASTKSSTSTPGTSTDGALRSSPSTSRGWASSAPSSSSGSSRPLLPTSRNAPSAGRLNARRGGTGTGLKVAGGSKDVHDEDGGEDGERKGKKKPLTRLQLGKSIRFDLRLARVSLLVDFISNVLIAVTPSPSFHSSIALLQALRGETSPLAVYLGFGDGTRQWACSSWTTYDDHPRAVPGDVRRLPRP
ncbi:hypothetical protein FA13DRAFT_1505765 [Coprinellus micaceus]|uniref:Uncharacterized protein n=1 Tax=Coprinellus micaceus TaxID=71717 RepID=A0A4Y7TMM5_COPMI|nr:hypothetical protein FA13DRAFT_1505765 [Coprinellus micaceus]